MKWKILSEKSLLKIHPWFDVSKQSIELPDGRQIHDYYQLNQPSYVEIAVLNKKNELLVFNSYKHGVRGETLGFPGGYIDKKENAKEAAVRELHEECAITAASWTDLGSYVIDGNRSTARVYMFLAEDLSKIEQIESDDLEEFTSSWIDVGTLRRYNNNLLFKTLGAAALAEKVLGKIIMKYGEN